MTQTRLTPTLTRLTSCRVVSCRVIGSYQKLPALDEYSFNQNLVVGDEELDDEEVEDKDKDEDEDEKEYNNE